VRARLRTAGTVLRLIGFTAVVFLAASAMVAAQTGAPPAAAENVNDAELEQFAQALQGIQVAQQEIQVEMQQIVQESPLGEERFNEIHEVVNTTGNVPDNANDTEIEHYGAVVEELGAIQQNLQLEMATIVEENDMEVERFNAIVMAIQQDEQIWNRVQEMMN
jgi:hypothetical protein